MTSPLKIDALNTFSFPLGAFRPILRGKTVSFREGKDLIYIRKDLAHLGVTHSLGSASSVSWAGLGWGMKARSLALHS